MTPSTPAASAAPTPRATATIVFDLDGTLALGRGPVIAYARSIAAATDDATFVADAEAALDDFEAGRSEVRDGYDAVGTLARRRGVSDGVVAAAYLRSRDALGTEDGPVHAPAGIAEFLREVSASARVVLATNAPESGVPALLAEWGIAEYFSATHFTVGKPAGLSRIVAEAITDGPVLSIGDIAEFDLAPALALGAEAALVGPTAARATAAVQLRGSTVADLYDDIRTWAAAAASSTPVS